MTSRVIRTKICYVLTAVFASSLVGNVCAQIVNFTPAGVEIDAKGVLRTQLFPDPTGQLTRQRMAAAKATLDPNVQRSSKLRKISLNRLEKAVAARLAASQMIDDVMSNLAGLTQITNVFYYPETKDIVIAGPAEGYYVDVAGRVVGLESGKAILRLEDLIVALRAFPPSGESARVIGCSIDPTKEGNQRFLETYRQLLAQLGGNIRGQEGMIVNALRNSMGLHEVTIKGVSPKSHFAQVLVEADYHMKLIGIGLEQPPVKITSWVERVNPSAASSNGLQRWFFTPNYDRVRVNESETAMELVGDGVQLVGESELVRADGGRVSKAGVNRASENFCRNFTEKFTELAQRSPIFAGLRNLMDMSIAAAFIQEMDYYGQSGWQMPVFSDESRLAVENCPVPTQVEPAINALWKQGRFMAPIGGGVNIQARKALTADNMKVDEQGQIDALRAEITLKQLAPGQWWWD